MKMIKLAGIAAALMFAAGTVQATHVWESPTGWWRSHFYYDTAATPRYLANELTLDMFGSYQAGQRDITDLFRTSIRRGDWGGGVGLNYFFTRELGIGVDTNIPADGGRFFNHVAGSFIMRAPIEQIGLAPYVFGGGGRSFDPVYEWTGHVGTGLELRMNPVTGFFVDGRYVFADRTSDTLLLRAGVRLAF